MLMDPPEVISMSVPAEKMAALLAVVASVLRSVAVAKGETERIEEVVEVGIEAVSLIVIARLSLERSGDPVCWLVDCFAVLAMTDEEEAMVGEKGIAGEIFVNVGSVMVCNLAKLLLMLMSPLALRLSLFPELRDALVRVMLFLEFRLRLLF